MMAIATTDQFWNHRLNGDDPTSPTGDNNNAWTATGSGASEVNKWWVVTDARYNVTPTSTAYTLYTMLQYTSTPDNDEVLLALDNGTYKVEVKAFGEKVKLVGATTVTSDDLDISMAEDNPVPLSLRLTLDASGNANLYLREMVEDDDAQTIYLSVAGAAGSSKDIQWGNNSGDVEWASVYMTDAGAFSPLELAPSDLATDTLLRMGLSVVDTLRNSRRAHLKTHLDAGSIRYGYDLSQEMLSRSIPPFIHVVLRGLGSPTFAALGGGRIDQEYDVLIYVTTRGTTYEDAYRMGLNIVGECFDELYTTTGLNGTTDSLYEYNLELQSRLDDDVTICTHMLTLTYMRRINMRHR
jgi:hypothetical protein